MSKKWLQLASTGVCQDIISMMAVFSNIRVFNTLQNISTVGCASITCIAVDRRFQCKNSQKG